MSKRTKGNWIFRSDEEGGVFVTGGGSIIANMVGPVDMLEGNGKLIAVVPELVEALKEGRRAIGDHNAPSDCYATGPVTGDGFRDLVQCPACSFIAMFEAVMIKGGAA